MNKALFGLVLLVALSAIVNVPHVVASSAVPTNNRVFYFTSTGTLSSAPPTGSTPSIANLTRGPLTFGLPQLLQPKSSMTISGQITFVLYTDWENNLTRPPGVSLIGTLSYHYPSLDWTNRSSSSVAIQNGPQNVTIPLAVSEPPLLEQSTVTVQIKVVSPFPKNANVSLIYGSSSYRSLVVIPMSGYETIDSSTPISITDRSGNPPPFQLNAAIGSNVVEVKLSVSSALGFQDIKEVNMSVIDPSFHSVYNRTMQPSLPPSNTSPYEFIGLWPYPNNSTQGTYQVWISIIDSQNNVALNFQGPSSFGLVPPGFIPFPYNLIPYLIVGGVVAAGGLGGGLAYRRKRRKSYLVPFDHFNTLTGGGLGEGTSVTIEGNTGSGKSLLLEQLMAEDLRNGRQCVFVTTGDFPDSIRSTMKAMGFDASGYEQNGLLTFVDGYSAEAGKESHEKIFVPSLGDLTTLGVKISSALPSPSFKGGSLYFDSLTPLASKAKPESIVSLVQSIGAKVKGLSGKAFFTMGLGIDSNVQRQLEDTSDCIVQMEAFEESGNRRRRLRIAKLRARKHQEGWVLFTIEDGKGIIFYSKSPKQ